MERTEAEKARLTQRINEALAEALRLFEVPPKPETEPQADAPEADGKPGE